MLTLRTYSCSCSCSCSFIDYARAEAFLFFSRVLSHRHRVSDSLLAARRYQEEELHWLLVPRGCDELFGFQGVSSELRMP